MITKSGIKDTLMALEFRQLETSREAYAQFLRSSTIDSTEPNGEDQVSQAEASAEIAQAFDATVHVYSEALHHIEQTDFGATAVVGPGAALMLAGQWYLVAVATQPFEHEGTKFMGISCAAPIYDAARGLRAGDRFDVNGRTWLIEAVA